MNDTVGWKYEKEISITKNFPSFSSFLCVFRMLLSSFNSFKANLALLFFALQCIISMKRRRTVEQKFTEILKRPKNRQQ